MTVLERIGEMTESVFLAYRSAVAEGLRNVDITKLLNLLQQVETLQRWYKTVRILAENQFAFTDDIDEILIDSILDEKDVENAVKEYYLLDDKKRLVSLIDRCNCSIKSYNNIELFSQIVSAFEQNSYHLACIGLFAVIDGLLSQASMKNTTGYRERFKIIHDKVNSETPLSRLDKRLICLYYAFDKIDNTAFRDSRFHEEEPSNINRHWTIHGRSRRHYELIDCIKLFQWVEAIIIMDQYDPSIAEEED